VWGSARNPQPPFAGSGWLVASLLAALASARSRRAALDHLMKEQEQERGVLDACGRPSALALLEDQASGEQLIALAGFQPMRPGMLVVGRRCKGATADGLWKLSGQRSRPIRREGTPGVMTGRCPLLFLLLRPTRSLRFK
jgi:hypothetical protein